MQSVGVGGASASADGRYVVFASRASNLVVGDTNGVADIFLRDRMTAATQRISQRSDGSQSDCIGSAPSIDPDGRHTVFTSCGALAAPATDAQREVYRYDRITGGIELVSVGPAGRRANSDSLHTHLSDDGRIVGFASCATDLLAAVTTNCQVIARDMLAGTTQLISRTAAGQPANGSGGGVRVTGSGQHVLFGSAATDLVADDKQPVRRLLLRSHQPDYAAHQHRFRRHPGKFRSLPRQRLVGRPPSRIHEHGHQVGARRDVGMLSRTCAISIRSPRAWLPFPGTPTRPAHGPASPPTARASCSSTTARTAA